jgi:hypothetical protein
MDLAPRTRLHERVTAALLADPRVAEVRLAGSLAGPRSDEHSDVDLVAVLRDDVVDRDFFFALPALMDEVGPNVPGWGFHALPDTYVGTFHYDDQPLFWGVDVECSASLHVDGTDLLTTYRWEQIYKMWIHAAKYAVRGDGYIDAVAGLTARHVDVPMPASASADRLLAVLDAIRGLKAQRGDPYEAFHARCVALCGELRHPDRWVTGQPLDPEFDETLLQGAIRPRT